jgi:hypothetical protein
MVMRNDARNWRQHKPVPDAFSSLFNVRTCMSSERIHSPFMVDFCRKQAAAVAAAKEI